MTRKTGKLAAFIALRRGRAPAVAAMHEERATQFMRAMLRSHPKLTADLRKGLGHVRMVNDRAIEDALVAQRDHAPVLVDLCPKLLRNESACAISLLRGPMPPKEIERVTEW